MPWRTPNPTGDRPTVAQPTRRSRGGFFSLLLKALIGLFATLGFLVVTAVIILAVVVSRYERQEVAAELPERFVLTFDLARGFNERPPDNPLEQIAAPGLSVAELHRSLAAAADDERVACLALHAGVGGLTVAQAQEFTAAVNRFRESGKFTLSFAATFGEGANGLSHYLVASAFEEVWLQPSGAIDIRGFRIEQPFLREALDDIGIEPLFIQREEFKSAVDSFQHAAMTEPVRGNLTTLAESWLDQSTESMARQRGLEIDAVDALVQQISLPAAEAQDSGLVDRLGYLDEAEARVEEQCGEGVEAIPLERYADATAENLTEDAPVIALIHGLGPIVLGSADGDFGGRAMVSGQIAQAIEEASKNDDVRAIVLRIDSPGGSYVGSDVVWREVRQARARGKPVVVSMVNVAASGGYFIAAAADRIVALPATVTGSIGVISGKFDSSRLWQQLGIGWDGVKAGENADLWSFTRPFDEEQLSALEIDIDRIYQDFLARVAEGRDLPIDQVRPIAGGRVWSGKDANARGLVDDLGGFDVALDHARELIGLDDRAAVRVVPFPEPRDPFTALLEDALGGKWGPGLATTEASRNLASLIEALTPLVQVIERLSIDPSREPLRAPGF